MLNGRPRSLRRVVAGAGVSALILAIGVPGTSYAEPTIEDVQGRVDALYHDAEAAQERLHGVRVDMKATQTRLRTLQRDLRSRRAEVERMGDVVAATIAEQAQNGAGFGVTGRLLVASDPDQVIDTMVATEAFNAHQGAMLTEFAAESEKLERRTQQVAAELKDVRGQKREIAAEKKSVDANLAEAQELLSELKAEERARLRRLAARRAAEARAAAAAAADRAAQQAAAAAEAAAEESAEEPTGSQQPEATAPDRGGEQVSRGGEREQLPTVPASGGASAAVDFALAQVGDSYVYGASGPDAWDCSGLTAAAWGAAGVALPHSSSAQMSAGTPVSRDQLQPGDLVFYYSPVSHVGIYIGNGQLAHAANPSTGVSITSVDSMPFSGAVRPG
ncbi:MAG TPA: NlpC/P60 family protein [Nocardioidaceae bacterium]|nr:NlpC/P60 family protein [Nocardioidaceae bacterium]